MEFRRRRDEDGVSLEKRADDVFAHVRVMLLTVARTEYAKVCADLLAGFVRLPVLARVMICTILRVFVDRIRTAGVLASADRIRCSSSVQCGMNSFLELCSDDRVVAATPFSVLTQ